MLAELPAQEEEISYHDGTKFRYSRSEAEKESRTANGASRKRYMARSALVPIGQEGDEETPSK